MIIKAVIHFLSDYIPISFKTVVKLRLFIMTKGVFVKHHAPGSSLWVQREMVKVTRTKGLFKYAHTLNMKT